MLPRMALALHAEADKAAPATPTEADDSSTDVASDPSSEVHVEVTLRRAISGDQLGPTVIYNVTRGAQDHITSLGTLLARARQHEKEGDRAYSYFFMQSDGRRVDCADRVYDKIVDYVGHLESIPFERDGSLTTRHEDGRYHRLDLLQYEMEHGRSSCSSSPQQT